MKRNHPPIQAIADEVAARFVHRLFSSLCRPAYLACPDDACAELCQRTIAKAAKERMIETEIVDLQPAPAARLDAITARLRDVNDRTPYERPPRRTLLILDHFDLLEGRRNEAPTFPFRSRFQFDEAHLWLFMGRDVNRLRRMFGNHSLPLYAAASNITPDPWEDPDLVRQRDQ